MRLWKLQDLFDAIHEHNPKAKRHLRLIHVCKRCQWRTPELTPLDATVMSANATLHPPQNFEIRDNGYCDRCNQECWAQVAEQMEHVKNNCGHCGGGRCKHYIIE